MQLYGKSIRTVELMIKNMVYFIKRKSSLKLKTIINPRKLSIKKIVKKSHKNSHIIYLENSAITAIKDKLNAQQKKKNNVTNPLVSPIKMLQREIK